jgi:hypothetical protein
LTKEQIIIAVLGALCLVLLLTHLIPLFRRIKRSAAQKWEKKEAEKQALADTQTAGGQISKELLVVLLTAAANSVLSSGDRKVFRVVSFRRIDKK